MNDDEVVIFVVERRVIQFTLSEQMKRDLRHPPIFERALLRTRFAVLPPSADEFHAASRRSTLRNVPKSIPE